MAHVILGLLLLWPQSFYDLTKSFEAGVSLFYSASTGSIKRALDRLLADGHIRVESETGPRQKKTYAVTEAGRTEFRRWMLSELSGTDVDGAMLARVHFLGLVDADERPTVAARIDERLRRDLGRLERLEAEISGKEAPAGFEDVARYQLATLQYGLASHRAALSWSEEYLPKH